jgi:drug/metabolite transporter (DMT)-like permease
VVELIALAIVGTILPAALNYLLVQRVGATRASVAMFLMPLIAVLFGVVFLDERLGLHALVGMGLILAGSLVVNGVGRGAPVAPPAGASSASPPIG